MLRSSSPAMSEISVGSPSPPPRAAMAVNGFHVLNIKRLKPNEVGVSFPQPMALPQRRKSSAERVKSFSIADILGKKEEKPSEAKSFQTKRLQQTPPAATTMPAGIPSIPTTPNMSNHLLAERLQPQPAAPLSMLDLPSLQKVIIPSSWDPSTNLTLTPNSNPSSLSIHPFFPPALLHYEQRLAWDYQRQLQEHFHAQAQLLRQMSMDPNIIPSEDGSERSRSSSAGSQCYSPDVNVADEDDVDDDESEGQCSKSDGGGLVNKVAKSSVEKSLKSANDTPLDALFQLSTKNFDEDQDPATLNIFATRPNPKKKRKSRTAFTNHQIFELEKRFLYQKYLSPADRDEIAAGLGLSNAQVITWFQNRRAKLKRDMEELKKDVESVKQLSAHKSFLENVNDLSILKTRPVSRNQPTPHHPPAEVHSAAHTHGNHITGVYTTAPTGGLSEIIQHNNNSISISNNNTRIINTPTTTTTIKVELQPHHPHNLNVSTTAAAATTPTNTFNERREANNNTDAITSQTASGQPQLHWQQQHQQQQPQQYHQQPRNLQINSSRG